MKKLVCLIFIICFCSIFVGCSSIDNIIKSEIEESRTETRVAKNNDIENVDIIFPTNRSVTIRFVPKYDIEELKLKIILTDKNEYLLDSVIETVGDVTKGQQYVINYQLDTNSINDGKRIDTCEVSVYSGSISYTINPGIYYPVN